MFIYSNHYLILSKITQEDFKNYYTHEQRKFDFTVIDDTAYLENEYIDLGMYEYESYDYVQILPDPIDYNVDLRYAFLPSIASKSLYYFQQDEAYHEYYYIDGANTPFVQDQTHYTRNSEPFYSLLWAKMFSFYLLPSKLKPEATEEEKAKDLSIRKSKIARGTRLALDYKEEDLSNNSFRFPKHQMLNPNNPTIMYVLTERDHNNTIDGGFNAFETHDINQIINHINILDSDLNDQEYWHEPTFVFPLLREMFLNEAEKDKDFFPLSYTGPTDVDFHNLPIFDNNVGRYS
jgi:hypothetical protein